MTEVLDRIRKQRHQRGIRFIESHFLKQFIFIHILNKINYRNNNIGTLLDTLIIELPSCEIDFPFCSVILTPFFHQ